ncbi:MAG: fasciclin domain-containing protein [Brevundimonas sp.]|uniref:fasciclin domain-containing protein n=1 Tax=Brevundimonas sp. TaxID=1871086 RepID=UPI0027347747|nr:fasciclin domain-containing protein [Brevundimonas sp.]MBX9615363.1 fasciclin domain-containing protein [Caulobacteraceae bacterium]MDP3403185.1 fasciclin domain-containing protein [Brevundimonas sp.]
MNARILTLTVASAALLGLAACNSGAETEAPATEVAATETAAPAADGTIVAVAQGNPDFSTLVSAVTAAELVETLNGPGPFTVFAPNNAAFAKIPADTLNGLLQPAQKEALAGVLTYHVVSGRVDAAALTQQIQAGGGTATLTTVAGGTLTASVGADGSVTLTDAKGGTSKVIATDVAASNGVVHVIDTVVMPG